MARKKAAESKVQRKVYEVVCPCGLVTFPGDSSDLLIHLAVCKSVAHPVQQWVRNECDRRGLKWRDVPPGPGVEKEGEPRAV